MENERNQKMSETEFRNLTHGEKIKGPDGTIYVVHNNHRSGEGMIVAVRSVVIPYRHSRDWKRVGNLKNMLVPGTYQVTIDKKVD